MRNYVYPKIIRNKREYPTMVAGIWHHGGKKVPMSWPVHKQVKALISDLGHGLGKFSERWAVRTVNVIREAALALVADKHGGGVRQATRASWSAPSSPTDDPWPSVVPSWSPWLALAGYDGGAKTMCKLYVRT